MGFALLSAGLVGGLGAAALPATADQAGAAPASRPGAAQAGVVHAEAAVPVPARSGAPNAPVGGEALGRPGVVTQLPAGVPAPPALPAGAYVLADLDSGDVIVSHNAHAKALPASTLKTLTALTLVPKIPANTVIKAEEEDAAVDGTKVGIDPGAPYTAGQLFASLLMVSANDAAVALARANGGNTVTTQEMNAVAAKLGAHDTVAKNTSGLDAPGQTSSAYDLALIGRAALANADIAAYVATKTASFPGGRTKQGQKRQTWQLISHNRLLWNYEGTIGVKNGYTVKARQTYIGAARRGDRAYILTYLNNSDGNWRGAAKVFDWAFAYGPKTQAVGTLDVAQDDAAGTSPGAKVAAAGAPGAPASEEGLSTTAKLAGVGAGVVAALAATVVALRVRAVRRMRARR